MTGLLGGRYRLDRRLALGGMGEVWQGRDTLLDRPVAIKIPRAEFAEDPAFLDRFRTEARHAASVTHPNVATVFDVDGGDEAPYLIMELVEGESLAERLASQHRLPAELVWSILRQVAGALSAAHTAGLCHRDIKPGNLLLRPDGRVVVTDFGIARALDGAATTQTGLLLGTAQYISPERVRGEPAGPASDLYALGVVAYQCLAGRQPFDGEGLEVLAAQRELPVPPLPPEVAPELAAVVAALMDRDPARRPTADQLAEAASPARLAGAAAVDATQVLSRPVPAPPPVSPTPVSAAPVSAASVTAPRLVPERPRPVRRTPRPDRRRAAAVAAGALGLVAVVVAASLALSSSGGRPDRSGNVDSTAKAPAAQPFTIAGAQLFHPGGSDQDHPGDVRLAYDGKPGTAWQTQHYASVTFGNLRPGVGLVFDLGRPEPVRTVRLSLASAGAAVEVHAGPAPGSLLATPVVGTNGAAPVALTITPPAPVTARYWLVWFSRLPSSSGHQAGVAEVQFQP